MFSLPLFVSHISLPEFSHNYNVNNNLLHLRILFCFSVSTYQQIYKLKNTYIF